MPFEQPALACPGPCTCLQVVAVAATFVSVWRLVSATLAELDLLAAFAEVAASAPAAYVRPTMLPSEGAVRIARCAARPPVSARASARWLMWTACAELA